MSEEPVSIPVVEPTTEPAPIPVVEPTTEPAPIPVVDPVTVVETSPVVGTVTPVETITLADIMNSREIVMQKEAEDRATLESIGTIGSDVLRGQLIQWASTGFPNAYSIKSITITPPQVCSDGIVRNLADYIQHCSTKTLQEHIAVLQARLPDIVVSFSFTGSSILIVLLKQ